MGEKPILEPNYNTFSYNVFCTAALTPEYLHPHTTAHGLENYFSPMYRS